MNNKIPPVPPNIHSEWFWSNYRKGFDWIKKHETAYWKSQAMALSAENENLLQLIHENGIRPKEVESVKSFKRGRRSRIKRRKKTNVSEEASEISLEVSKEMLDFFKASIAHKENLRKEKEKADEKFIPPQELHNLRQEEMKKLYGEGYSKILAMETAMQLSYERYMDQKSPEYWPKIPLQF